MNEALILMGAFLMGWFCATSSGAIFSYIVFRTKKEQHESFFPAKPRKSKGPIVMDEFASDVQDDDSALPPVIQKMNARMGAELAKAGLRGERNG